MNTILKFFVASILVAVASCLVSSTNASAASVWTDNGHAYEVVYAEGITWTDARNAAQNLGAGWDLVSISSQAENDWIISLLPSSPPYRSHFWLGASRPTETPDGWGWTSGDPFAFAGWGFGEEPNDWRNGFPEGNKVAFDFRGYWGWNDTSNDAGLPIVRGYVAESASPVPLPATVMLLVPCLFALLGLARQKNTQLARAQPAQRFTRPSASARGSCSRFSRSVATLALLGISSFASAGIVVVNNDEWTTSQNGFNATAGTARFVSNLTTLFAPQGHGKFLAYSNHPSYTGAPGLGGWGVGGTGLRDTIEGAGHSLTVTLEPELNEQTLASYDGVFLIGGDPQEQDAKIQALEDYVQRGGNVFVQFGTGPGRPGLLAFTERFGLSTTLGENGVCCLVNIAVQNYDYPLFTGVSDLFFVNGNWITLTDPSNPMTRLFTYQGQGLFGVYDPSLAPAPVPLPAPIVLLLVPAIGLARQVRRGGQG